MELWRRAAEKCRKFNPGLLWRGKLRDVPNLPSIRDAISSLINEPLFNPPLVMVDAPWLRVGVVELLMLTGTGAANSI